MCTAAACADPRPGGVQGGEAKVDLTAAAAAAAARPPACDVQGDAGLAPALLRTYATTQVSPEC